MPFYNKGPSPVVPYAPNAGSGTYPLDAVLVGGLDVVTDVFNDNNPHAILAAPAAGSCYRLQRATFVFTSSGSAEISGGTSGASYAQGVGILSILQTNFDGLLCLEALVASGNATTSQWRVSLFYDVINIPHIS